MESDGAVSEAQNLRHYNLDDIKNSGLLKDKLLQEANEILRRNQLYSVVDKQISPPSGDKHDYLHPAPYWWPNPKTADGLPYVRRDGERITNVEFYTEEGVRGLYDRTRLQFLFDDSLLLALAWAIEGRDRYVTHAIKLLKTFFIDKQTRMNPNMTYAQVIMGKNNSEGLGYGIIELKDIYYYLDAVRLMESSGYLDDSVKKAFHLWLREYLGWLHNSSQGAMARDSSNNHGTFYDLQALAISDYLDDKGVLFESIVRAKSRIKQQFTKNGLQPEEVTRTNSLHYSLFNIHGWLAINRIARVYGTDFIATKEEGRPRLLCGMQKVVEGSLGSWPYEQIDELDPARLYPVYYEMKEGYGLVFPHLTKDIMRLEPRFSPHFAILPYWQYLKVK